MSQSPVVDRIRIIPRQSDFLDRNVGSSGEVFFNKETSSLRVYSGKDTSGFEIARADLSNVTITNDDISWIPYATLGDLPSATDNHGMFAHVHSTGKAYYAHAGSWIALANQLELADAGGGASVDVSVDAPSDPESGNLWLDLDTGKLYIYVNDGNSSQWIQPDMSTFSGDYNDLINKPNLSVTSSINDLSDVDTVTNAPTSGQVLKWNGTNWVPAADIAEGGAGLDATTLNGQLADYYLNYNNFTNTPTSFDNLSLTGVTTLEATTEVLSSLSGATGTVIHDLSVSAVFTHASPAADFTANFTNVPTTNNRTISVALIIDQFVTPFMPTAVEIGGVPVTINWQGGSEPSGTASGKDVVSFTLIRSSNSWTIIGSSTGYS
jgi:hypothetical protein